MRIFGEADDQTQQQMANMLAAEPEARGVLCADNHLGYGMPIGGVVAYREYISPNGVGYDIACGNCAVRTSVQASDVDIARVMDEVAKVISFGVGRANGERIAEHPVFDAIATSPVFEQRSLLSMAIDQLGTVGSGNHYVDLFEDRADGALWIGVHFGSRGFGHKTATHFLHVAAEESGQGKYRDDMMAPPALLKIHSEAGQDYIAAMTIAGQYAYAGRDWVVNRVLQILGASDTVRVHNHHNFAWVETHAHPVTGEPTDYMVVRKGATPAWPGVRGFIGGSMGEDAVIIEGVESPASAEALYSTVHGAGRAISRKKAKGKTKITRKWVCRDYRKCDYQGAAGGFRRGPNGETPKCPNCGHKLDLREIEEQIAPGLVNWPQASADVKALGIKLRGGGADEAPACYKRLPDVLAAHGETIRILHRLRVVGVAMAGSEIIDPYKD
jgi:tRNA-splicing ligase RtcB (3'-phosphate/5'-hydroxy nucleic acid ligase)